MKDFKPGHGFTKADWDEVSANPELTAENLKEMRPFGEVFPDLAKSHKRTRGKQKSPTKQLVSLRLDRDVLEALKASGEGWQSRINEALRRVAKLRASKRAA